MSAPDGWAEAAPILAGIAAASVQGTVAMGARAGARVRQCDEAFETDEPTTPGRCQARQDGFDLQAAVRVQADERARLERLCRYALRPPVARDRLHRTAEGNSCWPSGIPGRMARRTCCLGPSNCWNGWRC